MDPKYQFLRKLVYCLLLAVSSYFGVDAAVDMHNRMERLTAVENPDYSGE